MFFTLIVSFFVFLSLKMRLGLKEMRVVNEVMNKVSKESATAECFVGAARKKV